MAIAGAGSDSAILHTQKDYLQTDQEFKIESQKKYLISESAKLTYDQALRPGNGASNRDMKSINFNISSGNVP